MTTRGELTPATAPAAIIAPMEVNGVAHTFITAGDFERSVAFYRQLLPFLGMREVADSPDTYYCVGGRTGFGIRRPEAEHAGQRFVQFRVGLHHHCWRARDLASFELPRVLTQASRNGPLSQGQTVP